jgi:hypothetical protein
VLVTQEILDRGMRLVFGAQPAIAEMVLSIGSDKVPESEHAQPRILIFQSRFFEGELPGSTLDLATWNAGLLVFTPEVHLKSRSSELERRADSLQGMREIMVSVPNLRAGVFIGGMDGVRDEAAIFREHNPGRPLFPLVSTGSAARFLYQTQLRDAYVSPRDKATSPDKSISYTLVADDILKRVTRKATSARTKRARPWRRT